MPEDGLDLTLLELLDRVLDKGVVIRGDAVISVADVDLLYIGLQVLLGSVDKVAEFRLPDGARVAW